MKLHLSVLSASVLMAMANVATAATEYMWTLDTGMVTNGASVTPTAWADTTGTKNGSGVVTAASGVIEGQSGATNASDGSGGYFSAGLALYGGGLGITNKDACSSSASCTAKDTLAGDYGDGVKPEHALDNNGRYEMVLLTFSDAVNLTKAKLGWSQTDSDMTILAYTGSGAPSLDGKIWSLNSSLSNSLLGWTLVGNYANVGTTNAANLTGSNTSTVAPNIYSSYWLVGAYNPLNGTAAPTTAPTATSGLQAGNDYIKLASVSGTCQHTNCTPPSNGVPEPGSIALFGLGLLGLMRMRKSAKN